MLGVKIIIFLIAVTIVWTILVRADVNNDRAKWSMRSFTGKYPKWFHVWCVLLLIDLVGILYIVFYFLFLR